MRKFPLITALVLILCAIGVYAIPNVDIVEDHVNLPGTHGDTLSGSFIVKNDHATEYIDVNFTVDTLTNGTYNLYVTDLNNITDLENGESREISFSVVIPNKQRPGLYTGTLTATSNITSDAPDTVEINVDVTHSPSVSTDPLSEMNLGSASLNSTHTRNFTITNTGNDDITNVSFGFSESGFNLQANNTNFVLAFNTIETIQFNITIPADYSTGNITLGAVTIDSTELDEELFDIKAEVGGGLIIEDLDVFLTTRIKRGSDGILRSDSGSDLDVYDGRKLNFDDEDAGPESEIRFNFNIENTFTDKEDIDINDISVKVTIQEIDDGDDLEEESNEFDLESDSNEDVDVIIKIPLSVEQGVYDVIIEVQGEDDNGNEHTDQMNLKIDVDKEARDVIVSKASLFPEKVKCSGTSTLTATIKNIGKKIEKDAGIKITNSDLNINFVKQNIELDEDPFDFNNEFTKRLTINVGRDTPAGTYPITVNSYIHEGALWETKTVKLVVEACGVVEEQEEEEPEVTEEIDETETVEAGEEEQEEITEGEEIPVLGPTTTTEVPLTKKPIFWLVIAILNIIIIAVVASLIVKIVGKK